MKLLTTFLISIPLWSQGLPGAGVAMNTGGTSLFGTPSAVIRNSGTGGASTVTKTTTAGDLLLLHGNTANVCSNLWGGAGTQLPTATGGETFIPLPVVGSSVLGATVTSGGSTYSGTSQTCTITGAGGSATCTSTSAAGAVTGVTITNGGALTSGPATITIADPPGGHADAAVVAVTAYGLADGGPSFCSVLWAAYNIPGTASEVFTMPTAMSVSSFNGWTVAEVSGPSSSPLDVAVGASTASAGSITMGAFNTANANEIVFCPTRVESTTNSWTTPGSGFSFVSGADQGGTDNFSNMMYRIFTTTQLGLTPSWTSSPNGTRTMQCIGFHN